MKKILKLSVLLMSLAFVFTSCSKDDDEYAYYELDGVEEMQYIIGYEDEVIDFINHLNSVMSSYDGTSFSESEIVSSIQRVVDAYNYGVISGSFYLNKSKDGYDYRRAHTFYMTFGAGYTQANIAPMSSLK